MKLYIFLFIFSSCLSSHVGAELTDVKIDFEKIAGSEDTFIMKVKPIGSLVPPYGWEDAICAQDDGVGCGTFYSITIGGTTFECKPFIIQDRKNTSLRSHISRLNSSWLNKICQTQPYKFDGKLSLIHI